MLAPGSLLLLASGLALADEGPQSLTSAGQPLAEDPIVSIDEDPSALALERGLAFLAEQQRFTRDGSFPAGEGEWASPVGVTALCALAFMADGSSPSRGPYRGEVGRAIDYLLSKVKPADHEHAGYIEDVSDRRSQTHGHGLATLALAQAYSMSPDTPRGRRTRTALEAAVRRIEVSQGIDGGWYYSPTKNIAHEGSVTVCLVQGLRAARNVGIYVDTSVIGRAIEYVKSLQMESGGFRYGLGDDTTSIALTAACLSTLHATGIYDGKVVEEGYEYIWREHMARGIERENARLSQEPAFPFYERYYLSQALWQHRDTSVFTNWVRDERRDVLLAQKADGSWDDRRYLGGGWVDQRFGKSYATAMNCLFLALPTGLLPIFQR